MKFIGKSTVIRSFLTAIILITALALTLGCGKKEEEVIKIGAILPLTGDVAVWGNNTKEGIDLAVDEINKSGGVNGKKIRIINEDSEALPQKGVAALKTVMERSTTPGLKIQGLEGQPLSLGLSPDDFVGR